ncbi:MAG TPA: DoxX family protein [Methylomirabilota bacterium]|nr:DoxX family protein [Methylomirabilota bacterium]
MNVALWIIQILMAALFLFAGVMKFIMPMEEMQKQMPVALSAAFIYFIGVAEAAGGLGLILPSVLRIRPGLTPLAACGLVLIMAGAVWLGLISPDPKSAIIPAIVGLLLGFVAYGRSRLAPLRPRHG